MDISCLFYLCVCVSEENDKKVFETLTHFDSRVVEEKTGTEAVLNER